MSAIALGGLAAIPSYFALILRTKTSLDDSLDVVAAHGVGGTVGALLTGVFAQKAFNAWRTARCSATRAARHSGDGGAAALIYSGAMSFILLKLIGLVMPPPRRKRRRSRRPGSDAARERRTATAKAPRRWRPRILPAAAPCAAADAAVR